jgi:hypothetical protein
MVALNLRFLLGAGRHCVAKGFVECFDDKAGLIR